MSGVAPCCLSGIVKDQFNNPISGVNIYADELDPGGPVLVAVSQPTPAGAWFYMIPAGEYPFSFQKTGYSTYNISNLVCPSGGNVEVNPVMTLLVGSLRLVTKDSAGNNIPATVSIPGVGNYQTTCSGSSCEVTVSNVPIGTYSITGSATGCDNQVISNVTVTTNNQTNVVFSLPLQDIGQTTSTTGVVTVNTSKKGLIDNQYDIDWYKVYLIGGKTYQIDIVGSDGVTNPYLLGVADSSGDDLDYTADDDSGDGNNSRLYFTPDSTGNYFVKLCSVSGTGVFTIAVTMVEVGNTVATAIPYPTEQPYIQGAIDVSGDVDWYKVYLDNEKEYKITLGGAFRGQGTVPYSLHSPGIYNSAGSILARTTFTEATVLDFTPPASGDYYLAVSSSYTGTYRVTIEEGDIGNTISTPCLRLFVNDPVNAVIGYAGDVDWFKLYMYTTYTYTIDLEGSPTGKGTLSDPYIRGIYDVNGTLLANTYNDDGGTGLNSRLVFTPPSNGYYHISAGAYSTNTGSYTISVTKS